MAASAPFILRVQAEDGASPALRKIGESGDEAKRRITELAAAAVASGNSLEAIEIGAAKAAAGTAKAERDVTRMGSALDRLAAAANPVVAAFQQAERAEKLLADAQAKGVTITAERRTGVEALRANYERMVQTSGAVGQAELKYAEAMRVSAEASARSKEAMAARNAELERTVARFVPLIGLNQQYRTTLEEISRAERAGLLTTKEAAAARDREAASYERARDAMSGKSVAEEAARRVAAATEQQNARLLTSLDGTLHAYDRVAASAANLASAERTFSDAQSRGLPVTDAHRRVLTQMRAAHEDLEKSSGKVTNALGLQRYQVQNVSAQFVDFGVQISSGGGILLPLIQQAPQAIDAVGGVSKAMSLLGGVVRSPLFAVGIGAVAFGGLVVAAEAADRRLSDLRNGLRAYTSDFANLSRQIDANSRAFATANPGTSRGEVTAAQTTIARAAPGLSAAELTDLTTLARDLGKTLDKDLAGGADRVVRALRAPAALIGDMSRDGLPQFSAELLRNVEALVRQGKGAEAAELALQALKRSVGGAGEDKSGLGAAIASVRTEFSELFDVIGQGLARYGRPVAEFLARDIRDIRQYASGTGPYSPPAGPTDPTTGILPIIRRTEGGPGPDAYSNTYGNNRYTPNRLVLPLEQMNLAAIREVQSGMLAAGSISSSVGAYQINRATLDDFAPRLGLNGSTIFDRETQDRIAQAIIRSVGDVSTPEGLGRLRGRFEGLKNVPDDQIRQALNITAATINVDAPAGTATAAASSAVGRALTETPEYRAALTAANSTLAARQQALRETIQGTERQIAVAPAGSEDQQRLLALYQEQRVQLAGLKTAEQERTDRFQDQIATIRTLAGATRTLAEAEVAERRLAQNEARAPDVDGARARAQQLLNGQLGDTVRAIVQETDAQERKNEAAGRGIAAIRASEIASMAQAKALETQIPNTDEYTAAVTRLTAAYTRQQVAAAAGALAGPIQEQERTLALLEREGQLIGANADVRERELAIFRVRQQVEASGAGGTPQAARLEDLAARTADARVQTDLLRNSASEVNGIFSETGDTIRTAIVGALATGEAKAISFGNVFKAVQASIIGKFAELALVNPITNSFDGGTRGTLSGYLDVLGRAGAGQSGAAPVGAPGGGFMSQAGGLFSQAGGALSQGWNWISNALGFGSGAAAPAVTSALPTAPSAGFGSVLGGIGLGFGAGTTLNGLIGGKSTGGAIGSGIGSAIGAFGGPLGSLAGGAVGGLIGGLFGAKPGFSGGVGRIGLNDSGALYLSSTAGKKIDLSQVEKDTEALISGVNSTLKSAGVKLEANASKLVAEQGFGGSKQDAQADLLGLVRSSGRTGSQFGDAALRASKGTTIEEVLADGAFGRDTYGPMIEGLSEFDTALEASRTGFQTVIDTAAKLGLATEELSRLQSKAADDAFAARDRTLAGINNGLDARRRTADGTAGIGDQMFVFDRTGEDQVRALNDQLKALGFTANATTGQFAEVVKLQETLAAERLRNERDYNAQVLAADQQRRAQLGTITATIDDRRFAAGNDNTTEAGALAAFDRTATKELSDLAAQIAALGFTAGEAGGRFGEELQLEQVQAAERLNVIKQFGEQAAAAEKTAADQRLAQLSQAQQSVAGVFTSIADYARNLQVGSDTSLTPDQRLAAAQGQFQAVAGAAAAGDYTSASQVTQYAEAYRQAATDFGAGPGRAAAEAGILAALEAIGNLDANTLTASAQEAIARQQTDRVVDTLNSSFADLRAEVRSLRLVMTGMAKQAA